MNAIEFLYGLELKNHEAEGKKNFFVILYSYDLFPEKLNQISITENSVSLCIIKVKKQLMFFDFFDWYLFILGLSSLKFILSVKFS